MDIVRKLVFYIEKKIETFTWGSLFIYVFSFLYLRQLLETALCWNLRIGTYTVFWESLRLLVIDYPIFYINVFLIISIFLSILTGEKKEKVLKIIFLFAPIILIPYPV
jgi:hypothetical protein